MKLSCPFFRISRDGFLVGLVLAGFLAVPGPARATTNLRLELAEVAKGIKQLLDGRKEDSIAVGAFTGPSHLESSSGPVITKTLAEELEKLHVGVKRRANLEVKGDYLDVVDKKSDRLAARLKARVLDRTGTVIVEFERGIFGEATISSMFGITAQIPPQADERVRDKTFRNGLDQPRVYIHGTRVASVPGSLYAMEILVAAKSGAAYKAGQASEEEGMGFVRIRRGEVFAVRLINDADHEVAVTLTIDGLNMFTFSEIRNPKTGLPKHSQVIVDPKSSVTIKGWQRTDDVSEEFVVTEYSKSAAAEVRSTANVGTITAVFAAVWPRDGRPPADEPPNPKEHSRSGDATGRGSRFEEKYIEVERNFGVVRDSISVHYTR